MAAAFLFAGLYSSITSLEMCFLAIPSKFTFYHTVYHSVFIFLSFRGLSVRGNIISVIAGITDVLFPAAASDPGVRLNT